MAVAEWLDLSSLAESSRFWAVCHCFGLAFFFVSSLYVWHLIPGMAARSRNDVTVIRCRTISGSFVKAF